MVDSARGMIRGNVSPKKTAAKFWDLSGGIIHCGSCSKPMFNQRLRKSSGDGHHHYSRCRTRGRYGPEACSLRGMRRADELEDSVRRFVSDMLKDPERLRADLERAVEYERRSMRGDPGLEARARADELAEVERKRSGFKDMAAEKLITLDELRAKLAGLEETRRIAERGLGALRGRHEALEALERDQEAVVETYARMAPEALDCLNPEERHQFYRMLKLRVVVQPDGTTDVSGAYNDEHEICTLETISPCRSRRIRSGGRSSAATLVGRKAEGSAVAPGRARRIATRIVRR